MKHLTFAILLGLVPIGGCSADAGPESETVAVTGKSVLTVGWTLDGTSDPRACAAKGADEIDLVVESQSGAIVEEIVEYCESSVARLSLAPGRYNAHVTLLDQRGNAITNRVYIGPITLHGDDERIIDADFPHAAFH